MKDSIGLNGPTLEKFLGISHIDTSIAKLGEDDKKKHMLHCRVGQPPMLWDVGLDLKINKIRRTTSYHLLVPFMLL